jgi:inosine/xanthosine triphosphate pyrophosphatase family protein
VDGKSLRLELDSENENRFCKWWRETPAKLALVVALRRAPEAEIELVIGTCDGRIADKPAGPHVLGWDRLFVPAGEDATLAELGAAGEVSAFRREVYTAAGRALGVSPGGVR